MVVYVYVASLLSLNWWHSIWGLLTRTETLKSLRSRRFSVLILSLISLDHRAFQ